MATINVRLDNELKQQTYAVLADLNISPSEAIRLYFQYIADNRRLPVKQVVLDDEDAELIRIAKHRLENPQGFVEVSLDDL
ncbi:type II toxin-antitoxin system RelB/DinJ family antitoxin [Muribacter muris]|uniref:Type II toxin-antitoxin system RelB/DinJ family antitoxin n=1 Tax=Muribacter muris TaxID=67855 RepID=A0A4Y9JVV2_9PAST|nr:type II toxin-antitoxin system RelB/DinJ family antitoxin [Muribacter muris]MBF0785754.1 type II toxin-antitoxin system RelB/DinJ family antitoxin [Muribacter muris]MBF0828274.1 type II toxin-antitoxin system RelB/DinJ family antitoxin [Muribacter muris]TFV08576.1 type II toxin-antitoxin system RelB/DinJ family antitoxin [Muribacter muris]